MLAACLNKLDMGKILATIPELGCLLPSPPHPCARAGHRSIVLGGSFGGKWNAWVWTACRLRPWGSVIGQ